MIDGRQNDVLLQGGHVIDPANGIDGPADVLISDGKIAEVGPGISAPAKAQSRRRLRPVRHAWHHRHARPLLRDPRPLRTSRSTRSSTPSRSGVTTVVDAGTAGWRDFPIFKLEIIDKAKIRILSYVNIVGQGMGAAIGGVGARSGRDETEAGGGRRRGVRGRRGRHQNRALLGERDRSTTSTCPGPRSTWRSKRAISAGCRSWSISAPGCRSGPTRT